MEKATLRSKADTVAWALRTAWSINGRLLLTVFTMVAVLAILPAISLIFNREVIAQLSGFIMTGTGSFEQILPPLLGFGAVLAVIALSTRINSDFIMRLMENAYSYGTQEFLMDSIHGFEIQELMRRNVNEDFNYIVRQSRSLNKLVSSICSIGGKAFSIISLGVLAWSMSPPVLVITAVYIVVIFALNATFSEGTRLNFPKFRKAEVKAQYLQNMPLEGNIAKEIRVYGCAERVAESWGNAYSQRMDMEIDRFRATEQRNFLMGASFYVFLAVVIIYLLTVLANGETTPAVFLVIFSLCASLFAVMGTLGRDLLDFDDNLFKLEQQRDLFAVTAASDLVKEPTMPQPVAGDIVFSIRDLTFSYDGNTPVLDGISLDIRRGEVIALIGENGSGKTTLVKLLIGLFKPTSGELFFQGRPRAEYPFSYLSRKIGVFFQDFYLFHHTFAENVSYGDVDSIGDRDKVREAISRGGASRVLEKLPKGIDTLIGRRVDKEGAELSGGEKQLVATARAYMSDKDILIFDEPASMLDPLAEIAQFQSIRNRIGEKTGILISHRVGFARLADRIVMMEKGRIVEVGTHDELIEQGGVYARFFQEQAQWYDTADRADDPEKSPAQGEEVRI